MPATAPLRHLKECRQRKCNTGEIPHATLRKSICIFEEKVLAKNTSIGKEPVLMVYRVRLKVYTNFGILTRNHLQHNRNIKSE